jgi:hypothetical protein
MCKYTIQEIAEFVANKQYPEKFNQWGTIIETKIVAEYYLEQFGDMRDDFHQWTVTCIDGTPFVYRYIEVTKKIPKNFSQWDLYTRKKGYLITQCIIYTKEVPPNFTDFSMNVSNNGTQERVIDIIIYSGCYNNKYDHLCSDFWLTEDCFNNRYVFETFIELYAAKIPDEISLPFPWDLKTKDQTMTAAHLYSIYHKHKAPPSHTWGWKDIHGRTVIGYFLEREIMLNQHHINKKYFEHVDFNEKVYLHEKLPKLASAISVINDGYNEVRRSGQVDRLTVHGLYLATRFDKKVLSSTLSRCLF